MPTFEVVLSVIAGPYSHDKPYLGQVSGGCLDTSDCDGSVNHLRALVKWIRPYHFIQCSE